MPNAIVSLVPSLTEFLIDIGVGERLVGRTKFCIHPSSVVSSIPTFGGTKNPKVEQLRSRKPDLIVMNREENRKDDAEAIAHFAMVHMTDILTVDDALREMETLGHLVDREESTASLISQIHAQIPNSKQFTPLRVAYFIWRKPWMVAASSTYIDSVLRLFSLQNIFDDCERYPEVALAEVKDRSPDMILLSSEPFPFAEHHIAEISERTRCKRVLLVDGTWFSWYGSRMLSSFKNLQYWRVQVDI